MNKRSLLKYYLVSVGCLLANLIYAGGTTFNNLKEGPHIIEISWREPIDLDLFLTGPKGETIYFANRLSKNGMRMRTETGCTEMKGKEPPFIEQAVIPSQIKGKFRVSVDFINSCNHNILSSDYLIRLLDANSREIGRNRSKVQYRLLNTIGWEFIIQ